MKKNKRKDSTKISPIIGLIPMERVETKTLTVWMNAEGMRMFQEALKKEVEKNKGI